jgi:hypothetical protein
LVAALIDKHSANSLIIFGAHVELESGCGFKLVLSGSWMLEALFSF